MGTSIVLSVLVLALVGASQAKYQQETIQPIQRFSSFGTSQTSPFTNTRQSILGNRGFSNLNTVNGDVSSAVYRQTSPVFATQNVLRNNVVGVNHNQKYNVLRTNNNNIHGVNHNQRFNTIRTNNNIHGINHNQRFNTIRTNNNNNIHGVHHNQRFHSLRNNNQRVNFRSTNSLNGQFVSGNQYLGSAAGLEDPNLLSHRSESDGLGSYNFAYQTADGVTRQEEGTPIGLDSLAVRGSYSYTSPEGVEVVVNYVADENGFQVQSPNVPAIPEHSRLQILRAEEARRRGIDLTNAGNGGAYIPSNFQTRGDSTLLEANTGLVRPLNNVNLRTTNFGNQAGVGLTRNFNTISTSTNGFSGNNRIVLDRNSQSHRNSGRFNHINDHQSGLGLTRNLNTISTSTNGNSGRFNQVNDHQSGLGLTRNLNTVAISSNGNSGRFNHVTDHQSGLDLTRNFNSVGTSRSGVVGNHHHGSTTRVVDLVDTNTGINTRFTNQINGLSGHFNGVRSGSTFARRPTSFSTRPISHSTRLRTVRESTNEESHKEGGENKKEESSQDEIKDDDIIHKTKLESTSGNVASHIIKE